MKLLQNCLNLILIGSLLYFSSSQAASQLVVAMSSKPNNLSPFFATDANSQNINRLIHLSLIDFNDQMIFECELCTSFTEVREAEKHILEFVIPRDTKFWDGTSVGPQDVVNSVGYYQDENEIKSVFRNAFKRISKVEVIGIDRVRFIYDRYYPDSLSNLSLLKILKKKGDDFIGAGLYQIKTSSETETLIEKINTKNRDISFKVVKDETTLALKLLRGEIDLSVASISPRKMQWLKEKHAGKIQVKETLGTNYAYLGINHKNEKLKNLEIRKSIAEALPLKEIVKYKLKETAVLANGMFSEAFADLSLGPNGRVYDPEKAGQRLVALGYEKGPNGFFEKGGERLSFELKVSNNRSSIELAQTFKNELEKIGIEIHVLIQEWGTFMSGLKKGDFQLFISQWVGFTGPEMLENAFLSTSYPPGGANRGHYNNSKVDQILLSARDERDSNKRILAYKQASKLIVDDVGYIDLWYPNIIWIARNCVSLNSPTPNGSFSPLKDITHECNH
jgi:peptide/nickel transport system substrate-binding protein